MARIVATAAVALLIGGAVGFALGRGADNTTTTIIERTITAESASDELRERFGIPTDEAACEEFGIPADACP